MSNLKDLVNKASDNVIPEELRELMYQFGDQVDTNALELNFLKQHFLPEYRKEEKKNQLELAVEKNTLKINHVLNSLLKNGNPLKL